MSHPLRAGPVVWIYGRPSAGKTTLAYKCKERLDRIGKRCYILDGDQLRTGLCKDLGFTMEDRSENLRRAAEVAKILSDTGLTVIAAFVTPLDEQRGLIRSILSGTELALVYLDCSAALCIQRDAKGLYRKALSGELKQMTGIGSSFEPGGSTDADITVSSESATPEELSMMLLQQFQYLGR